MYFRHAKRESKFGKLRNNLMKQWYLMVFDGICVSYFFCVCVCVFFGDTCSTVYILTVKVMLFFFE